MRDTHDEVCLELVVTATTSLADHVRAITFRNRSGGALPSWSPGAHIDLTVGDLTRQYSLCGPADRADEWTVAVRREENSRGGSARLHDAVPIGAVLAARGPRNHFPLENAADYLFIAGGIGIAALLPMIAAVHARQAQWRLVYGARTRAAMAYADHLAGFGHRVALVPEDEQGRLDVAAVMGSAGTGTAVYCCGPEGLVAAVEAEHARAPRGSVHVERFSPRELPQPPEPGSVEVEARRSGVVVRVDPDTSVLDALTGAGVRVLSSCREGICGTCELVVLEGVPDHRDSILTADERAAGETMFPCVSRCLSARLVLDV